MAKLRKMPWHANELLSPYRFFDVKGKHQSGAKGHSLINLAEIDIALCLYEKLLRDYHAYDFKGKIGIITPYKSQLKELKDRFSRRYSQGIFDIVEFNTTDAYQGRESEIIIFSCVRASPSGGIGFLQDIRRMNVGLTRAKGSLWVLGNSESLVRGEWWRKLVDDAKQRNRWTGGEVAQAINRSVAGQWNPDEYKNRNLGNVNSWRDAASYPQSEDVEMDDTENSHEASRLAFGDPGPSLPDELPVTRAPMSAVSGPGDKTTVSAVSEIEMKDVEDVEDGQVQAGESGSNEPPAAPKGPNGGTGESVASKPSRPLLARPKEKTGVKRKRPAADPFMPASRTKRPI
jgi:senataxin